jgi:ketosteroid isomerase-like protein
MTIGGIGEVTVERVFAAINAGERETVLELAHPALTWRPSMWSGGGPFHGREGLSEWLDQFGPHLEHLSIEVEEITQPGRVVLVLGKVRDTRHGVTSGAAIGWTFVVEDGLIIDGCAYNSWDEARSQAIRES